MYDPSPTYVNFFIIVPSGSCPFTNNSFVIGSISKPSPTLTSMAPLESNCKPLPILALIDGIVTSGNNTAKSIKSFAAGTKFDGVELKEYVVGNV